MNPVTDVNGDITCEFTGTVSEEIHCFAGYLNFNDEYCMFDFDSTDVDEKCVTWKEGEALRYAQ